MSKSDVYRRQALTSKVNPRTERLNHERANYIHDHFFPYVCLSNKKIRTMDRSGLLMLEIQEPPPYILSVIRIVRSLTPVKRVNTQSGWGMQYTVILAWIIRGTLILWLRRMADTTLIPMWWYRLPSDLNKKYRKYFFIPWCKWDLL